MRRVHLLITAGIICLGAYSCIKKPSFEPKPDNGIEKPDKIPEDKEEPEITDLAIKSFVISKELNSELTEDITFEIYSNNIIFSYLKKDIDVSGLTAKFEIEGTGDIMAKIDDALQINELTTNDFSKDILLVIQDSLKMKSYTIRLIPYTGLPVAILKTDNVKMPTSKDVWVGATLQIDGMGKFEPTIKQSIEIKRRGNSTFGFAKKAFNIKLMEKQKVLGMKKHKRWILLANYRDKTLLRNDVTFHIGQNFSGLKWTPHNQFIEMILNGEYIGNYELTEQIRIDNDRIDIPEMLPSDISNETLTGGYLLETDMRYDDVNKFRSTHFNIPINIKEPDEDILNPIQFAYIEQYINEFDSLLNIGEFQKVYDEYIDITSFADFWLVQEITGNTEYRKPYSTYFYKDRNGKLFAGPLWDFDYSTYKTGSYAKDKLNPWYKAMLSDPTFKAKLKERYNANLAFLNSVPQYIESKRDELRLSATQNWIIWSDLTAKNNDDEELSSDEAIDRMIDMYNKRVTTIGSIVNAF